MYQKIIKELLTNPSSFFNTTKQKDISFLEIALSLAIVLAVGSTNILTVIYIKGSVSGVFLTYTVIVTITMWVLYSYIVHIISNLASVKKYSKFTNTLFGIGISRTPMIAFVALLLLAATTHRLNIASRFFVMVNVITTLWMLYLYVICINKFYNVSSGKAILVVITSFIIVLAITTIANNLIGIKSISL